MAQVEIEETVESKLKRLKREKREAIGQLILSIVASAVTILVAAGFAVSMFHLMTSVLAINVIRYGFSTVVFAVLLPRFAVSNKRK